MRGRMLGTAGGAIAGAGECNEMADARGSRSRFSPRLTGLAPRFGIGRMTRSRGALFFAASPFAPPLEPKLALNAIASAKRSGSNGVGPLTLGANAVARTGVPAVFVVSIPYGPRGTDGPPKTTGMCSGASVLVATGRGVGFGQAICNEVSSMLRCDELTFTSLCTDLPPGLAA